MTFFTVSGLHSGLKCVGQASVETCCLSLFAFAGRKAWINNLANLTMAGTIHQLRQERRNKLLAKHSIQSTNRRPPPPPPGRLPPPPPPSKFQVGTAGTSEDESESDDDVIDFTVVSDGTTSFQLDG